MDIFDIIPDNFFNTLSSKNKRLYFNLALEAFKIYENGSIFGVERKIVVDELVHYLEENESLLNNIEVEDEEINQNTRDTVNYVLRRLENTGWIYIDVTNDYVDVLNFTDYAITLMEALNSMLPKTFYNEEDDTYEYRYDVNEYQGYLFTIYSILENRLNCDYSIVMQQLVQNTKNLVRSLRKLDNRIKDYINSVVENEEIKNLMDKLVNYNIELFSASYAKLKTGDNFNKYKLSILNNLNLLANDSNAIEIISSVYNSRYKIEDARTKTFKELDEIIDVFNQLDQMIQEIDNKNKIYINTTIGKVKFLLSETDNIVGKLNQILKYVKYENQNGNILNAMTKVNKLITLNSVKGYTNNSLYTPRGKYSTNYKQTLDLSRFDIDDYSSLLLNEMDSLYDPKNVSLFMEDKFSDNKFMASTFINHDSSDDDVMMLIYSLIYASENDYSIVKEKSYIDHNKFKIRDFSIIKEGK